MPRADHMTQWPSHVGHRLVGFNSHEFDDLG